jgi:hypothetical protein
LVRSLFNTSGADPTTSLRHLLIGSIRLKLISTSD